MIADTMKAAVIEGPGRLAIETVPVPAAGRGEALVRVHCVGICATDMEIYDGSMAYFRSGSASYPVIPGHEWSGEVVAIGEGVMRLAVGDRVVGETTIPCRTCAMCKSGSYNLCPNRAETGILGKAGAAADYVSYPEQALHRFDGGVAYEEACLIEPAAVAYRGALRAGIVPGDTVAVLGAGAIGLLTVQMARALGAGRIVLFDYNERRLNIGRSLGADLAVNLTGRLHAAGAAETDAVEPASSFGEFAKVIEASGSPQAAEFGVSLLRPGGGMTMLGLCGGKRASVDMDRIVVRDLELRGSLGSPGVWREVIALLEARKIDLRPLITNRLTLAEYGRAIELLQRRDPATIKVVINVRGDHG
ncbi:zinc-binding dehydrogenase [Cohnella sp. GCM10020058]|uniref:zinc-dependent alcohol dehydrogenase n=1 Tax=Cohnella sp. GCM10020058 TaxID=3317330 RepID=UPI00362703D9